MIENLHPLLGCGPQFHPDFFFSKKKRGKLRKKSVEGPWCAAPQTTCHCLKASTPQTRSLARPPHRARAWAKALMKRTTKRDARQVLDISVPFDALPWKKPLPRCGLHLSWLYHRSARRSPVSCPPPPRLPRTMATHPLPLRVGVHRLRWVRGGPSHATARLYSHGHPLLCSFGPPHSPERTPSSPRPLPVRRERGDGHKHRVGGHTGKNARSKGGGDTTRGGGNGRNRIA